MSDPGGHRGYYSDPEDYIDDCRWWNFRSLLDDKHLSNEEKAFKYGRLALISLAIFSIPIDAYKGYHAVKGAEKTLDGPMPLEVFEYYSSTIGTHVVGLSAALDNRIILTIACPLLSTILYQAGLGHKGNSTVPTDPKELQKYIKENVPAHRLPKGYKFQDLSNVETVSGGPGSRAGPFAKMKRKKGSKKSKSSKGSKTSSKKTTKKSTAKKTSKKSSKNTKSSKSMKKTEL